MDDKLYGPCNFEPWSSGAVGNEEEGTSEDKDAADEEEQERLEALREAEERRKEKHRKMEEEREKMRQEIRDKMSIEALDFESSSRYVRGSSLT
ncbi:hypothetical protein TNCV_3507881 [Trichonephila clavipes]|uniref:Uncharacterized protein n=1 Tax=Trichonephila clavipes TaxID=2585209 RepID=A0A8X6S165_TRICX|nr:hypothetical protein TNCV_3507881 [Trichonephila clavipes]